MKKVNGSSDKVNNKRNLLPYLSMAVGIVLMATLSIHGLTCGSREYVEPDTHPTFRHVIDNNQYAYLASSILDGHAYLDLPVDDGLKELVNPYDFEARKEMAETKGSKIYWDYAYKDGHYYSYFGVVPALIAYVPYRAVTGCDLETPRAVALFSVWLVLACAAMTYLLLRVCFPDSLNRFNLIAGFLILILGSNVGYLTFNSRFYSVPILCSLCLTFTAYCFYVAAKWIYLQREGKSALPEDGHSYMRCANAFLFVGTVLICLNLGSRPQFILSAFLAIPLFWNEIKGRTIFSIANFGSVFSVGGAIAVCIIPLGIYNYIRFGSPLNLGSSYNLTGFDMTTYAQSAKTTVKLIYYYLMQPVRYMSSFPFISSSPMDFSQEWAPNEPMFGGLFAYCPVALLGLLGIINVPRKFRALIVPTVLCVLFCGIVLLVDARNAGVTQRYFSDFGIYIFFGAALCLWCLNTNEAGTRFSLIFRAAVILLLVISVSNVGFSIISPDRYDSVLSLNPSLYAGIEKLF